MKVEWAAHARFMAIVLGGYFGFRWVHDAASLQAMQTALLFYLALTVGERIVRIP